MIQSQSVVFVPIFNPHIYIRKYRHLTQGSIVHMAAVQQFT